MSGDKAEIVRFMVIFKAEISTIVWIINLSIAKKLSVVSEDGNKGNQ